MQMWGRAVKLSVSVGSPSLWELGNFWGSDLVSSSPPTCHQAVSRGSQLGVTCPGSGWWQQIWKHLLPKVPCTPQLPGSLSRSWEVWEH